MPSGARGARPRPGEWAPGGGGPSAEVAEQLVGVDGRAAGPACLITGGAEECPTLAGGRGTQRFCSSGWLLGRWLLQEPRGSPQSSQGWWGRDVNAQVLGLRETHGKTMFEARSPPVVTDHWCRIGSSSPETLHPAS